MATAYAQIGDNDDRVVQTPVYDIPSLTDDQMITYMRGVIAEMSYSPDTPHCIYMKSSLGGTYEYVAGDYCLHEELYDAALKGYGP
jgi:hypothetical protein